MTLPLAVKGTLFITQTATVSERKVPVHLFFSGHRHCNADQCLNTTAFSLSSGNTCILLPDIGPIHRVILPCDTDDTLYAGLLDDEDADDEYDDQSWIFGGGGK